MKIKILGAHNIASRKTKMVSLLVDNTLALDASAIIGSLSFRQQQRIKGFFLSHHHYDHVRDIPAVAMNALLHGTNIDIYAPRTVYEVLSTHLLNNILYPDFTGRPPGNPAARFNIIEPGKTVTVAGYRILPVPVKHSIPSVGYQVTAPDGRTMFYTGDTGPGLAEAWQEVSPHLLITELTAPDGYEEFALNSGHLTPSLLRLELEDFRKLKGYLPQVVLVHMNPLQEAEIAAEAAAVAASLDCQIKLGREGMVIEL